MPTKESLAVLKDLARAGVDVKILNSLAGQLDTVPNANKVFDSKVMAQSTFSKYMQNVDKKVDEEVKKRLGQFAALKDTLATLKKDSPEYQQLIATHNTLKKQLIEEDNYDAATIDKITLKTTEGLQALVKLAEMDLPSADDIKVDDTDIDLMGGDMSRLNNNNNNNQNFLTADDPRLKETMAGLALGSVNVQTAVMKQMMKYQRLFGETPSEDMVDKFSNLAIQNFTQGKAIEDTAEEVFEFKKKETEIAANALNAQLDQARKEGEAQLEKRLRDAGVPVDKAKAQTGVGARRHLTNIISKTNNPNGDTDDKLNQGRGNSEDDKDTDNGLTKFNDKEFELPEASRLRSMAPDKLLPIERRPLTALEGRGTRINNALAYVQEKNIDLTAD